MNELIKQEVNVIGKVKIELFDAKTGKLDFMEEGSNYISLFGKDMMRRAQKYALSSNTKTFTGICDFFITRSWHYDATNSWFARYLHLTADAQVENINESVVTQPTLAYVDLSTPYAGADTSIGTVNESESAGSLNQLKFVCDFGTDKANGTFQSIYLSPFATSLVSTNGPLKANFKGSITLGSGLFSRITADATYYYMYTTTYGLLRVNKTTFEETILTAYANFPYNPNDILHHNGYIYMASIDNSVDRRFLYRYNISTNAFEQAPLNNPINSMQLLATDGTFIYVLAASGNTTAPRRIGKFDPVSFTWVGYIDTSLAQYSLTTFTNMFFYGGVLHLTTTALAVYEVDYDTNTITDVTSTKPGFSRVTMQGYDGVKGIHRYLGYSKQSVWYYIYDKLLSEMLTENFTFFSRKRLSTAITKTNEQALKITYTFDFI